MDVEFLSSSPSILCLDHVYMRVCVCVRALGIYSVHVFCKETDKAARGLNAHVPTICVNKLAVGVTMQNIFITSFNEIIYIA